MTFLSYVFKKLCISTVLNSLLLSCLSFISPEAYLLFIHYQLVPTIENFDLFHFLCKYFLITFIQKLLEEYSLLLVEICFSPSLTGDFFFFLDFHKSPSLVSLFFSPTALGSHTFG